MNNKQPGESEYAWIHLRTANEQTSLNYVFSFHGFQDPVMLNTKCVYFKENTAVGASMNLPDGMIFERLSKTVSKNVCVGICKSRDESE